MAEGFITEKQFGDKGIALAFPEQTEITKFMGHEIFSQHHTFAWLRPEASEWKYQRGNPQSTVDYYFPRKKLVIDFVRVVQGTTKAANREAEVAAARAEIARKRELCEAHGIAYVGLLFGVDALTQEAIDEAKAHVEGKAAVEEAPKAYQPGVRVVDMRGDSHGFIPAR